MVDFTGATDESTAPHQHLICTDVGEGKVLEHADKRLSDYTASHPRRKESLETTVVTENLGQTWSSS